MEKSETRLTIEILLLSFLSILPIKYIDPNRLNRYTARQKIKGFWLHIYTYSEGTGESVKMAGIFNLDLQYLQDLLFTSLGGHCDRRR